MYYPTRRRYPVPPSRSKPDVPCDLTSDMRKAWEQHVYWTRMVLISIAERLRDQSATTDRLLRNPKDIAEIFARYYGRESAEKVERLLTEHVQIGGALITALRDGKGAQSEGLKRQWYANADKMSEVFSRMNPHYGQSELRKMLYRHLDLTMQEVTMRLSHNYGADVQAFNTVEQEALMMADYFSKGIAGQFPGKVS